MKSRWQKAAATRKRRTAARKAVATRKRQAAGRKAAVSRKSRARGKTTQRIATPSVIPMISYEDGVAALDWLARAFGFEETDRQIGPDGRLAHGQMTASDGVIMLASPSPDYHGPRRHREICEQARKWSEVPWIIDGVLVYVRDLDRHFARAKAQGATILSQIESGGPGRRYRVEDLEGHRWFFFEKD
jgi:PhnB protein